jgi:hypothetical protein
MTPNHKWLQHGRISNFVEIIWLILLEHTSPNFSVFHTIKGVFSSKNFLQKNPVALFVVIW